MSPFDQPFTEPAVMPLTKFFCIAINRIMIGRQAIVTSEIDNLQGIGQVTVGGQEWSARTEKDGLNLQPGTVVDIMAVSGVKLIVKVDPQMTKVTGEVPESQN